MQIDVLIIGQGLCGTFLSWELLQEGKSFLVMDDNAENSASKTAAGVINPVTGRRYASTWMIEPLMEFAQQAYTNMGRHLGKELLFKRSIIDFFPSPQMRNAFVDRVSENDTYLHAYPDQNSFNNDFAYDFGCGEISPAYVANVQDLLSGWRRQLLSTNLLLSEKFIASELIVEKDRIRYKDIDARQVIFCDGIASASNPFFALLPFAASKGEALIIECKDLPHNHIFKKGLMLVPLPENDTFWLGSSYQWEFENDQPTDAFYNSATSVLNNWLKRPYKVMEHKAALRPSTLERRPFAGFHPQQHNVGILNGMGTKGTSLAPFFAHQLVQKIVYDLPLTPEAAIDRFTRILSK